MKLLFFLLLILYYSYCCSYKSFLLYILVLIIVQNYNVNHISIEHSGNANRVRGGKKNCRGTQRCASLTYPLEWGWTAGSKFTLIHLWVYFMLNCASIRYRYTLFTLFREYQIHWLEFWIVVGKGEGDMIRAGLKVPLLFYYPSSSSSPSWCFLAVFSGCLLATVTSAESSQDPIVLLQF